MMIHINGQKEAGKKQLKYFGHKINSLELAISIN